jgi:hypothetical protein
MNIIRDCQDRVFSNYRSTSSAALGTPAVAPQSPNIPPQQEMAMASLSTDAVSEPSFGRTAPSFLQPPSPQIHLVSGLEVSDLQSNALKELEGNELSDSGFGSSETGILAGTSSSLNTSIDDAPLAGSQSQPECNPQESWGMDNRLKDTNSGGDFMVLSEINTFGSALANHDGRAWGLYMGDMGDMGMEDQEDPFFGSSNGF